MEISRQCLESLYEFKQKVLIDELCMEETIQTAVTWIVNGADSGIPSVELFIIGCLRDEPPEIRTIIQSIATLLLQSAKHAYTREQLMYGFYKMCYFYI